MRRVGSAPYYECSSAGDRRFSAWYAFPRSLNGVCIEVAYQAMKRFADGRTGLSPRQAKGRRALNQEKCAEAYQQWWREWVEEQNLLPVLLSKTGLSDQFASARGVCQATALWTIRFEALAARSAPKGVL